MKKRYYLCLKEMKWIHDAPEQETKENIRFQAIIAITRYVIEHPEKIKFLTKEKYENEN